MTPDNSASLWRAVIDQAITDACSTAKDRIARDAHAAAHRWLFKPSSDFDQVCALAGFEPDQVRRYATERLSRTDKPEPPKAPTRSRAKLLTFNGETRTLEGWAAHLGINRNTLYARLTKLGWSVEAALTASVSVDQQRRRGQARNFHNRLGDRRGEQRAIPSANGDFAP